MRLLMVPFSDRPESENALSVAAGLAQRIDANVMGSHLRPHRDKGSAYQSSGLPLFGSPKREWLEHLSQPGSWRAVLRMKLSENGKAPQSIFA